MYSGTTNSHIRYFPKENTLVHVGEVVIYLIAYIICTVHIYGAVYYKCMCMNADILCVCVQRLLVFIYITFIFISSTLCVVVLHVS